MTGKNISHYSIGEKLGEGGMGVVFKAFDARLERFVALKFLPEEYAQDEALRERFLREARAASALNHPNICTIYDIGEADGEVFIAMEFLDGVTLKELVRRGSLPLEQLLAIAFDVTEGLEAAHSAGIIHRDIKLANIFVSNSGRAKVLDFGLAKKTAVKSAALATATVGRAGDMPDSHMTSGLAALGTAAYMSPEQALGKPLDERTDLFSFGIVLYEMATGQAPFSGDTTGMLFLSVVQETPEQPRVLNPAVPDELQGIISKCLEKNRELRYQHASEVRSDLQRLRRISGDYDVEPIALQPEREEGRIAQEEKPSGSSSPARRQRSGTVAPAEVPNRKPRRRLCLTLGIAAAIFLAFIAATVFRLKHTAHAHALSAQSSIVVADFANTTGEAIFDGTLRQAVKADFEQSPFVNVVSDRRVGAVLKQMDKAVGERLSREVAREVCLRTNSTALIAGSIAKDRNGYELNLEALNCATAQTIASVEIEARRRDEVLLALGAADAQLRRKLGESLASVQKFGKPLAEATTSSLEALQAFSSAQSLRQQKGNTEALPYMKRAVELDPNFAQAYAVLGGIYSNLAEATLSRENVQRAFELRNRVSEAERFYIEAAYYDSVTGESEQIIRTCQEWIRSYPADAAPHSRLAHQYINRGQYEEAARELREAIRLAPDSYTPYANLVLTYMELKRLDEANATYAAARARNIDSENLELVRYDLAFVEGDTDTMHKLVEAARGKPGYLNRLALEASKTEAYFGRLKLARNFANEAMAAAIAAGAKEGAGEHGAEHALTQAEAGNYTVARELATESLPMGRGRTVTAEAALAFARAHETTQAEALAEQLNRDFPASTIVQNYTLPTIRAAVEIERKHPARAIELLQAALPYDFAMEAYGDLHPAYIRGVAYLQLKDGKRAAAEFQKVIDNPGVVVNSIIGALSYVQLARAEVMIGDRDAARTHYQDFLALWKNADPGVPIYKQAKAEYARLH